jgi:Predicted acyltransferase
MMFLHHHRPAMSTLTVHLITEPDELQACLDIRREVFIDEQGVSEAEEMDGKEDQCGHLLARLDGVPIGTTRLNWQPGKLKVQRVAVLKPHRGTGAGLAMIKAAIDEARRRSDIETVVLDSQVSAIGFYEKLGFVASGPVFLDAGIDHRLMTLALR